ncbi:hypothetical protein KKF91_15650, partial [Myxococcota bacterium]|nr:hypothetical protein [Myxococcota bacterium]
MLRFLLVCVLMLNSSMASAHLVEIDCSQADSVLDVIDLILNDGENTDIVFTSSGGICRMEMPFIDGAYGNYQLKSIEIHGDVSVQFQSFESFAFGRIIIKDRGQLTFLDGNHVMISTPDSPENSIFSGPIYVNSNSTRIDLYGVSFFNPESFINQHNSQGELEITNYGNLIIENPNEMWWPIKNENILNIDLFDEMVMTTLPILENTMDAELNIHNLIDQAQITASLMDQSRFFGLINLDESINLFVNVSIYLDNTTIAGDGILTLADGGNLSISNDISIRNLDVIG